VRVRHCVSSVRPLSSRGAVREGSDEAISALPPGAPSLVHVVRRSRPRSGPAPDRDQGQGRHPRPRSGAGGRLQRGAGSLSRARRARHGQADATGLPKRHLVQLVDSAARFPPAFAVLLTNATDLPANSTVRFANSTDLPANATDQLTNATDPPANATVLGSPAPRAAPESSPYPVLISLQSSLMFGA